MVKTFFLDWGLSLGAGLLFGIAARREAGVRAPFATRAFRWGLAYQQIGILAIAVTLYVIRPDWMWMYWVDPRGLPIVVVLLSFAMYELAFVAGFSIAASAPTRPVVVFAVAVGVALAAGQVAARARLANFGTLEEFRSGVAGGAAHGTAARTMMAAGVLSLLLLALMLRRLATSPGSPARGTQASP